ncbi:Phosphoinositide 3-kinase adapter protein 1 [Nymphon striatum]|nr:Phosphoinositide 3-kinase adapter protein 1 [Nymphon striatum]
MWNRAENPDISIIYSEDSANWHDYLLECFSQIPESDDSSRLAINSVLLEDQYSHKKVRCPPPVRNEDKVDSCKYALLKLMRVSLISRSSKSKMQRTVAMYAAETLGIQRNLPLSEEDSKALSKSCAQLVILSPAFLDYISRNVNVYEIGKLFNPERVVALLCGVETTDISSLHRSILVTYDSWQNILSVIDQDKDFVIRILRKISDILMAANEQTKQVTKPKPKPHFKVTPRRVKEGNNKVYVLLNSPIKNTEKVRVAIECNGGDKVQVNEVNIKIRNPFTIQFVVPGNYTNVSTLINVHVYCDDIDLGVQTISCLSKMGELAHLLHTITSSPVEFMCQALGLNPDSPDQLDKHLSDSLKKHELTHGKLSILDFSTDSEINLKSNEEIPTFLHFGAKYGFYELCSLLLESIGATVACQVKNSNGQTPAEIALSAGHSHIANLLADFQMKKDNDKASPDSVTSDGMYLQEISQLHNTEHSIPFLGLQNMEFRIMSNPSLVTRKTTVASHVAQKVVLLHLNLTFILSCSCTEETTLSLIRKCCPSQKIHQRIMKLEEEKSDTVGGIMETPHKRNRVSRAYLSNSQYELIEIVEDYKKKDYSLNEVELLFKSWLQSQKNSSLKEKEDQLRLMRKNYEAVQLKGQKDIKQNSKLDRCRQLLNTLLGKTGNKLSDKAPNIEISAPIISKSEENENKHQETNIAWRLSSTSSTSVDRISCVSHDSGNQSDNNIDDHHHRKDVNHCSEKSVKKLSRALLDPFYVEKIGSSTGPRLPQRKYIKSLTKEKENTARKYFAVPGSDHMYYEVSAEPEKRDSFGYVLPDVISEYCANFASTDKYLTEKPPLPSRDGRTSVMDLRPSAKQKSIFYDDVVSQNPKNIERKIPHDDDYIEMNTEENVHSASLLRERKISSSSEIALHDLQSEKTKLSIENYEILTNENYVSMDSSPNDPHSEFLEAPSEPPPPPPREQHTSEQKPALPPKCPAIASYSRLPPKPISTWRYPA